jgi:hypothetical protein
MKAPEYITRVHWSMGAVNTAVMNMAGGQYGDQNGMSLRAQCHHDSSANPDTIWDGLFRTKVGVTR